MWKIYALLSALFAAFTAIFAKIGVKDVDSNLATAIRTTIILLLTWGIVLMSGHIGEVKSITPQHMAVPYSVGTVHRAFMAVLFQGPPARRCVASSAHRQAQRSIYHSAVVYHPEGTTHPESHRRRPAHHLGRHRNDLETKANSLCS